jgi:DNA-binding beta-propeller fold protein YncE
MMNILVRAAQIAALSLPLTFPTLAAANPIGTFQLPTRHTAALTAQGAGNNFKFPSALAIDASGNLYVANLEGANVTRVNITGGNTNFPVTGSLRTANTPISLAVDTAGSIYVGNAESSIQKFNANGTLVGTITANAVSPISIAVDQYQDLFIATPTGLAIDDENGMTISPHVPGSSAPIYSMAIGGPHLYMFFVGEIGFVNGSTLLRGGSFPFTNDNASKSLGSACSVGGICWYSDFNLRLVRTCNSYGSLVTCFPGQPVTLAYAPAGVAYDATRNRLFVADPVNNAVHVYTASTLTFLATIK